MGKHPKSFAVAVILFLYLSATAQAEWFDLAWQYRRPIDVTWDAEHASGDELATAEFYSNGHTLPNAADVRVTTDDGKLIASHILMSGPGDRIKLVLALQKNQKQYFVYFGNPKPVSPPRGLDDVKYKAGVLLTTKVWTGGAANSFDAIEKSWDRSTPVIGQTIIDRPFIGYNPFGEQQQWISKFEGSLFAPVDGDYMMVIAADDEAALYIDGKPLIFAHLAPSDIRFNATLNLLRGRHDILIYHVNYGQDGRVAVGWKRPNSAAVEIIGRQQFGTCFGSQVGPLEEHDKTLIADFSVQQIAECFFNDRYSFRYHFVAKTKPGLNAKYNWDFGDGQTSTAAELDHVYLAEGIYPVRLTAHVGSNSDTQTSNVVIGRNYEKIITPAEDDPGALSKVVVTYDLNTMPEAALQRTVSLHLKANQVDAAIAAANKLATIPVHADQAAVIDSLSAVEKLMIAKGQLNEAIAMWDHVPGNANIQPRAVKRAAQLAMWCTADFDKAIKLLSPFKDRDDSSINRPYGQALLLSGQVEAGKKILMHLPPQSPADRRAVLSGASARTVEFFVTEKDPESGEDAWDRWQAKYPEEFLTGYSAMLRVKLIELRGLPIPAAKVAEAFARAVPQSSYAPQLLDKASKLLAKSDPGKSKELHQLLKEKYPEDPLSQN